MTDIGPNDEPIFSSLDDDQSIQIKEMIDMVTDVIMPKKEFIRSRGPTTTSSGGSSSTSYGGTVSRTPPTTPSGRTPTAPSRTPPSGTKTPDPVTTAPSKPKPGQTTDIGPPQDKNRAETPAEKEARVRAAKDKADAAGSSGNMASLIGLGLTAAAATALIAAALSGFIASDGAHIKFTKITAEQTISENIPNLFASGIQNISPTVTTLEVTWELLEVGNPGGIASEVTILEGDKIEWKNTGLEKLDGKDITVVRVKSDNVFVVESGLTDASLINLVDTGDGYIHTSYDDQLNRRVNDAAGGAMNLLDKATGGIAGKIGTIIGIVIGVILFLVIGGLLLKFMSSKKSSNNTQ